MFKDLFSTLSSWWGVAFDGARKGKESVEIKDAEVPLADAAGYVDPKADDPEPQGEDTAYAASNEQLRKKLRVYMDLDGYYEMDEAGLRDYESSGLTDAEIIGGYDSAYGLCMDEVDAAPEKQQERLKAIFEDMATYRKAKDPAYLASLPAAERTALVEKYIELENSHSYKDEKGKTAFCFGITAEEYKAMGETARADYDAMVAACSTTWGVSFTQAFDEYKKTPSVEKQIGDEAEKPPATKQKSGFWANLSSSVAGLATSLKGIIEKSGIGKKAVELFNGLKDRFQAFIGKKKSAGLDLSEGQEDPEAEAGDSREEIDTSGIEQPSGDGGMSL